MFEILAKMQENPAKARAGRQFSVAPFNRQRAKAESLKNCDLRRKTV